MGGEKNEPYKPHAGIEIARVPGDITEVPRTNGEIVEAAVFCFGQGRRGNLLPEKYGDMERWLGSVYDYSYKSRKWVDVEPLPLDYLFQQFAIKKDERLRRNAFNTFGLYIPSYLEGLRTRDFRDGYLGFAGWEHMVKDNHRSLLLGSSSITTADNFFKFIRAVNPECEAIVTDIDPLAVQLGQKAVKHKEKEIVLQSDAQRIPLADKSVDFIATNFLIKNLIDVMGSREHTLTAMLQEASRVLAPGGRLVMVEQLNNRELEVVWGWAGNVGLELATGGPDGGSNKSALLLPNSGSVKRVIKGTPEFIATNAGRTEHGGGTNVYGHFDTLPADYFSAVLQPEVSNLIFKGSRFTK